MRRVGVAFVISAGAILAIALDWSAGTKPAHAASGLMAAYSFYEGAGTTVADA